MHYICEKHGKIHVVGPKKPSFCPICGNKAFPIFPIPRIYVEKEIGWGIVLFLLIMSVPFGIFSAIYFPVQSYRNETKRLIANTSPEWRTLYLAIDKGRDPEEITQSFVNAHKNNLPYLTPDDLKLIMRGCDYREQEVAKLLMPYTVKH